MLYFAPSATGQAQAGTTPMHRSDMRRPLIQGLALILCLAGAPAQAAPYTPRSDEEVLEHLPFKASAGEGRELRALRRALAEQPQNMDRALALARRYFDLASAEGDPRYVGYAEAVIRPWTKADAPPPQILLMRALLRQYRHEFDPALADLARAAEHDPGNEEIWSWRSAILMVQADYKGARAACDKLVPLASALLVSSCNAIIDERTGKAEQAYAELGKALAQRPGADPDLKLWIQTRLAETALQLGRETLLLLLQFWISGSNLRELLAQ